MIIIKNNLIIILEMFGVVVYIGVHLRIKTATTLFNLKNFKMLVLKIVFLQSAPGAPGGCFGFYVPENWVNNLPTWCEVRETLQNKCDIIEAYADFKEKFGVEPALSAGQRECLQYQANLEAFYMDAVTLARPEAVYITYKTNIGATFDSGKTYITLTATEESFQKKGFCADYGAMSVALKSANFFQIRDAFFVACPNGKRC